MRASDRIVLDVPTARSGLVALVNGRISLASSAHSSARFAHGRRAGRIAGQQVAGDAAGAEWQRDGDIGVLVQALGELEENHRRCRPRSSVPADHPNQRRIARRSAASSGPEDVQADTGALLDKGEHLVAVGASRIALVAKPIQLLDTLVLTDVEALVDELREPLATGVGDATVVPRRAPTGSAILCEDVGGGCAPPL